MSVRRALRLSAAPAWILLAHAMSCNASRGDVALVEPGSPGRFVGEESGAVDGDDSGEGAAAQGGALDEGAGEGFGGAVEGAAEGGAEEGAVDPTPVDLPGPSWVAPSELHAYRCESASVRGRTPDGRPAVICAGPGLRWSHPDAEAVPCERCASACAGRLPAGGQCSRVEVRPDDSGAYSEQLTSAQLATGSAEVCIAHADGSALTSRVRLIGFGWIGGWIEPGRPDLGPDFLSFEGRVCAQLQSADDRPLSGVTLGFSSDWPTVFVDRQGTTDARGVGCAELILTGAVRSDVEVEVAVTSECPGGPPHTTVVPVKVVANPPSAGKSRLICSPSVLPAFELPGEIAECELILIDRFGERVLAPIEVGLATEAGRLSAQSVVSEQGRAVFTLSGGDGSPRDVAPVPGEPAVRTQAGQVLNPRDGYVSLIAWWQGEEGFTDDGDGFYGPGEAFIDLPEPWVDMDDDGAWSGAEPHVDRQGLRPDIWDAGNLQWDSHGVVWTETRVIFTDAPDPAGALDQGQGCQFDGPVPEFCGPQASGWRVTARPCRFSFPLHDRRLNPPAGLDGLELRVGALRPLPLLRAGQAGWTFHRAGGVIDAAFTREVGFSFDGVPSFSAHLEIRGLESGPNDLSLAIGGQTASIRGCVDP